MTNQQLTDMVILKQIMNEKNDKIRQHKLDVFYYNQTVRANKK